MLTSRTAGWQPTMADLTVMFTICPKPNTSRGLGQSDGGWTVSVPKSREIWDEVLQGFPCSVKGTTLTEEGLRAERTTGVVIKDVLPGHVASHCGKTGPCCGSMRTSFILSPQAGARRVAFDCRKMTPSDWTSMANKLVDDRRNHPESAPSCIIFMPKGQQLSDWETVSQKWEGTHDVKAWDSDSGTWSYVPLKVKLELSVVRCNCNGDCGGWCGTHEIAP